MMMNSIIKFTSASRRGRTEQLYSAIYRNCTVQYTLENRRVNIDWSITACRGQLRCLRRSMWLPVMKVAATCTLSNSTVLMWIGRHYTRPAEEPRRRCSAFTCATLYELLSRSVCLIDIWQHCSCQVSSGRPVLNRKFLIATARPDCLAG